MKFKNGIHVECPKSISSTRLILKPISQDFAQIIFSEFTPAVTRYMTPRSPTQLSETQAFIDDCITKRVSSDDFVFVILLQATQEFLGVCGVHGRANHLLPEFGIWTKVGAHGHGYGREAITALYNWCGTNLQVEGFTYPVDKNNISSRKIPESLGGVIVEEKKVPTMSGNTLDEVVYRIPVK